MSILKDALLGWADVNVITVDWFRAATLPYTRAAANTAIVGQQISRLINSLIESYGGIPENFHLIGHSLGSHVAGYAGGALDGLGRITALDPAGPLFATNEENNRLDPSDASFVDVIHTDKDCLGLRMPSGHVDFYPNGGTEQPGCAAVENFRDDVGGILTMLDSSFCSHFRAIKLFTESIFNSPSFNVTENEVENGCQFIGILCDTYDDFLQGTCSNDAPENLMTAILGIDADMYPERDSPNPPPTSYYLQTNAVKPYCS
ncbi:lipase member I-like [Hetaerina americana]|uniref:lipase member I-like n=1 Tax=Hetaerina americana TaxID=62018 RepID=UPI003A7F4937